MAIECRESDEELLALFSQFTDEYTKRTVLAERAYLNAMEGGCRVPIAGYSVLNEQDEIELTGLVTSPDGKIILKKLSPETIQRKSESVVPLLWLTKEPKN